ncbi:cytochrome P450 71D6 [Culex quinquefasciatus]|uniref:Cytochrome P450 71D6 n=1 Tax=Culex quinquefasciatus TaxID=7176 RepID=B0W7Y7_CULQU|nr:cytochrome P450 71D6 [Culex quinquefasciatus]|eukprot:XP_001844821.1 cytochrome P450 71D6 [Culex quinquefasciatus]
MFLITLLITLFFLSITFIKYKFSYWSRQNVPYIEPNFPYGNFKDSGRISIADISAQQYNEMKSRGQFFGMFFFLQPMVMITNLDLIKTILIKDFNYFPDRGVYHNLRDDPLSGHLFSIEGNKWRSLRTRLTPTFTSGKMRMMFPTLKAVGDNFGEFLESAVGGGIEMELKDVVQRFTTDVIGSCAFGIECNTFVDGNSQIRSVSRLIFDSPKHSGKKRLFLKLFPEIGNKLRIKQLNENATEFFQKLVGDTIAYRVKNSTDRNDFISLLIGLMNNGDLTLDEAAAQSLIFFLAGLETSSSNQTFCLYELALNQGYQQKARECIHEAMEKHGGLTYEAVSDMQYLDQCINETFRLYPAVPVLERKTFQNYQIPGTKVIIPKGMKVHIPVYGIQRDEQYYPNPTVFNPDRFYPDAVAKRHMCAFLPFGEGPRICIGLRFGMLQSRVGLATVLSRFRIMPCSQTTIPLEYSTKSTVLQAKGGLWLKVEPL